MPASEQEPADDLDDLEFVYEPKEPIGSKPRLYTLGGAALLAVACLLFATNLLLPAGSSPFPFFIAATVAPTLGALALFATARTLKRSPQRVTVGPAGMTVETRQETHRWSWNDVGWATINTGALSFQRQLVVYDTSGRRLVTLGNHFADLDGLADSVKQAIAGKTDDAADRVQTRRARYSAAFLILGGIAFLALAVGNGWNANQEKQAARRLAADGVETDARIVRHYMYNVTPRLEYKFTTPDGTTLTRDTMLHQQAWNQLQGAETVPVRYEPADPDNSRLVAGEVEEQFGPPQLNLIVSVAVGVMATLFLAVGVMQWTGWDIDLDSKTGRVSIKRFGTGR